MEYPFFYLLRSALIPELSADITAGAAGNVELVLVTVPAVRTFPYELAVIVLDDLYLAVISAYLTIVALGVEFRIHNVFIDEFHYLYNGRDIVLHIRNFNIADCSSDST